MAAIIKSFATNELLINNTGGAQPPIGVIDTYALTFSKKKGYWTQPTIPSTGLVLFSSQDDGVDIPPVAGLANLGLRIADALYERTLNSATELTPTQTIDFINNLFGDDITDLQIGAVLTGDRYTGPEWVSFTGLENGAPIGQLKFWMSNQSFINQYNEYEHIVIPPLVPLDDFFKAPAEVIRLLGLRTFKEQTELITVAIGSQPETYLWTESFNYHNPLDTAQRQPSNWTIVGYGDFGNNLDAHKETLQKYILANSTHTREEWAEILPDIFRRTEFFMIPLFTNVAIPNLEVHRAGIYSPVAGLKDTLDFLKTVVKSETAFHLDTYADVMGQTYRSIAIAIVSSAENRDGIYRITDEFPDYINVSTGSNDFNRMELVTQRWVLMIDEMIQLAERMTDFTDTPKGFSRVTRDGIKYVSRSYNNINYLVALKENFI